ncbi:proteasome lid subunit RPN8/RPN11 [Paraburkholderia sp. BL8N3]|nr:C40 family peptidase [Paraburkholderia sp. BL8N3]TCK37969.1 proteasome lid subunit RPN8/RPN11 [Paraburkholderia sp. BL8N3]
MNDAQLARLVPLILIHAQAEEPRECCGVVVLQSAGSVYIACNNLAARSEHFIIDPACYASAEDSGLVVAIAHSHPYEPPEPSLADKAGIERTGLPWIIVNYPLGTFTITRPSGFTVGLLARPFVHGVHDCYALVRDYFAQQGVQLADYARTYGWWNDATGPDLYRENFAREGFVQVDAGPMDADRLARLRPGDLLLMNIHAARDNHMAVYLGEGVILHHLIDQLSRREAYQEFYQRRTTAVLRHRSLMEVQS